MANSKGHGVSAKSIIESENKAPEEKRKAGESVGEKSTAWRKWLMAYGVEIAAIIKAKRKNINSEYKKPRKKINNGEKINAISERRKAINQAASA